MIDQQCLKAYRRAFHEWKGKEMQGQQDPLEAYEEARAALAPGDEVRNETLHSSFFYLQCKCGRNDRQNTRFSECPSCHTPLNVLFDEPTKAPAESETK